MNYLYFAEADVQTGGASNPEALLLPADSFLGPVFIFSTII